MIIKIPDHELQFSFSRSQGAGGQNVNKVNSKATLFWNYLHSEILKEEDKKRFFKLYGNRCNQDGSITISSQESRTQAINKESCLKKLKLMIQKSKTRPRIRHKTKPSYGSVQDRLKSKKKDSEKKRLRRNDF